MDVAVIRTMKQNGGMETKAASVMRDALQLPESDRTALAVALLESLDVDKAPEARQPWRTLILSGLLSGAYPEGYLERERDSWD